MNTKYSNILKLKEKLYKIFKKAVADKVFPGAVIGITRGSGTLRSTMFFAYGKLTYEGLQVNSKVVYDLASLTKPLATTLAILSLVKDKRLALNDNLSTLLECNIKNEKENIKLYQLLNHCSGIAGHRPYYKYLKKIPIEKRMGQLIKNIIDEPLVYKTGDEQLYSDLGFILLGRVVEVKSGMSLNRYVKEKIYKPIGLEKGLFFNDSFKDRLYAPTEDCPWRKKIMRGEVHDDNSYVVGGVSGHAGLFGDIFGVVDLVNVIKDVVKNKKEHPHFSSDDLKRCVSRQTDKGSWGLGFDTPSGRSSSGSFFSKEASFGHLGFTGTSFWVDIERDISVVLLTNRVYPHRDNNKIREFRPLFHNIIMQS